MSEKKNKHTGKVTHRQQEQRRKEFRERAVRFAIGFSVTVLALMIIVPLVRAQVKLAASRRIDGAIITLPPQQVDTLVMATSEPTAAPAVVTAAPTAEPVAAPAQDDFDADWSDMPDEEEAEPVIGLVDDEGDADDGDFYEDEGGDAATLPGASLADTSAASLLGGAAFEYLPVINKVDTSERKVAITVDDCFQVHNLQQIILATYKAGGKITIFPIGENLSKQDMPMTLRKAMELGYEIENHTWSHARVFRMSQQEMAQEIWNQDQALNQCLGVNYQEHFFRCMGGDGEMDQRTHSYLKQLGYQGVAHWSLSGSDAEPKEIAQHLSPGAVYLFHTTDRDTAILVKFIPWVVQQGYQLVTLNELVGLPDNEVTPLTGVQPMPEPEEYTPDYRTIHPDEYSWMVVQLQNRLRALGLLDMDGPSTGYYGKQTADAVAAFQTNAGLTATGEADEATQKLILAS